MCAPLMRKYSEAWLKVDSHFTFVLPRTLLLLIHLSPHRKLTVASNPNFKTTGSKNSRKPGLKLY